MEADAIRMSGRINQQHHQRYQRRMLVALVNVSLLGLLSTTADAKSQLLPKNNFNDLVDNNDKGKQQQQQQQLQRLRYPEQNLRGNQLQRSLKHKSSNQDFIFAGNEAFSNIYSLTQFSFPTEAPTSGNVSFVDV